MEIDVYHLEFYRECQPIKLMRVVPALEIDFYHRGKLIFTKVENWFLPPWKNCFLQPWKSIFTTVEIDFFTTVEKLFFTTLEIDFYHRGSWLFFTTLEIDFTTIENA